MFSATWTDTVQAIGSDFLLDFIKVTVGAPELTANTRIKQIVEARTNGAFLFL